MPYSGSGVPRADPFHADPLFDHFQEAQTQCPPMNPDVMIDDLEDESDEKLNIPLMVVYRRMWRMICTHKSYKKKLMKS